MKERLLFLLLLFAFLNCFSQTVSNIRYQYAGKQIVVFYDLTDPLNLAWTTEIFVSVDGGKTWVGPLDKVKGDIGNNIQAGTHKKVYWDKFAETKLDYKEYKFLVTARSNTSFLGESGNFVDTRNGITYRWVKIGKQVWMAQNLNIGIRIEGNIKQANNDKIEKYCYNNLESNCGIYGGLYMWDEAKLYSKNQKNQSICPKDWHLPTDSEWLILINELGSNEIAYQKMKERGNEHWENSTKRVTNESGFTVLPGGVRNSDTLTNFFAKLKTEAYFWTSEEYDEKSAYAIGLGSIFMEVNKFWGIKSNGFSVRCLKD